jgi:hypothetical protein
MFSKGGIFKKQSSSGLTFELEIKIFEECNFTRKIQIGDINLLSNGS